MDPVLQRFGDVTIQRLEKPKDTKESQNNAGTLEKECNEDLNSEDGNLQGIKRYLSSSPGPSYKKTKSERLELTRKSLDEGSEHSFSDEISDYETDSEMESEGTSPGVMKMKQDENTSEAEENSTDFFQNLVQDPFESEKPEISIENIKTENEDYEYDIKEKLKEMGEISFQTIKKGEKPKKVETPADNEVVVTATKKSSSIDEEAAGERKGNMRRNIREVMDETKLDESTLAAQRQEMERLRRVQEQQRIIREVQRQMAQDRVISLLQGNNLSKPGTSSTRIGSTVLVKLPNGQTKPMTKLSKRPFELVRVPKGSVPAQKNTRSLIAVKKPAAHLTPSVSIAPVGKRPQFSRPPSDTDSEGEELMKKPLQRPKSKEAPVATIDISSDDDCIVVSESENDPTSDETIDDPSNSGMHTNDEFNQPDEQGRVVVNIGHPEGDSDIYVAPQIARVIKPHQIGGVRFLFDNVVESTSRFETSTGFGCILAHSMGLGKTLQIVCFSDIFLRHTSARTILCIMPINTLQNWLAEYNMWLPTEDASSNSPLKNHGEIRARHFNLHVLNDSHKTLTARAKVIHEWKTGGGVLLIGYEQYRLLSLRKHPKSRKKPNPVVETPPVEDDKNKALFDDVHEALVKPGPDLVICDEGHRIKNSHASISQALKLMRTKRRVVLTGYPLQNNLMEYWCMVDFVRPNYLGTKTEFCNMFERPIQNGQCIDSTESDIKLMRYRAHVLHSLLVGFVQRRSHTVLQTALPLKEEYVLLVRMTSFQRTLYETFMNEVVRTQTVPNPLKAFAVCCKIWNHPDVLYYFLKKRAGGEAVDIDLEEVSNSTTSSSETGSKTKKGGGSKKNSGKNKNGGKPAASVTPYSSSGEPNTQQNKSKAVNTNQNQEFTSSQGTTENFEHGTVASQFSQNSQNQTSNFSYPETPPTYPQSNFPNNQNILANPNRNVPSNLNINPNNQLVPSNQNIQPRNIQPSQSIPSNQNISPIQNVPNTISPHLSTQTGQQPANNFPNIQSTPSIQSSPNIQPNQNMQQLQTLPANQSVPHQNQQNSTSQYSQNPTATNSNYPPSQFTQSKSDYLQNANYTQNSNYQNVPNNYPNNYQQPYQQTTTTSQNIGGNYSNNPNYNNYPNFQQNYWQQDSSYKSNDYYNNYNQGYNANMYNNEHSTNWIKKEDVKHNILQSPSKSDNYNETKPKINILSDIKLNNVFDGSLLKGTDKKINIISDIKLEVKKEELDDKSEVKLENKDVNIDRKIEPLNTDEEAKIAAENAILSKANSKEDSGIPYDWAIELLKDYVPGCIENSAKMQILFCIIKESIAIGDRLLVFSQSLITLDLIEQFLQMNAVPGETQHWAKNTNYYRLDGSTSALEREKLINEFNSNSKIYVFLVSTRAGSLGINLIGANRVVVLDASWNPCHDTQAVCRVYRYGQKKPCFVYRLVVDNCLEKKIYDRQINKQGMSDRVVDECNPDAHLTMKDVSTLCWDDIKEEGEEKDWSHLRDNYRDFVLQQVLSLHGKCLNKEPFQHESLLVDRKDKQLSQQEKRLAKKGYEREKQAARQPSYSLVSASRGHRPVASVRPMQQGIERPSRWIPAEHWQRQGMTAQEMTLPLDVVIPTNQPDKGSIVLKAGQKVLVLKSPKGVYMQLENGKIVAIKTAIKVRGKAEDDASKLIKPTLPLSMKPNATLSAVAQKRPVKPFAPGLTKLNMRSVKQAVPNLVSRIHSVTKKIQMSKTKPYQIGTEIAKAVKQSRLETDPHQIGSDDEHHIQEGMIRHDILLSSRKSMTNHKDRSHHVLDELMQRESEHPSQQYRYPRNDSKNLGSTLEQLKQSTSAIISEKQQFQDKLETITNSYQENDGHLESHMNSQAHNSRPSITISDHETDEEQFQVPSDTHVDQTEPSPSEPVKSDIPPQDYSYNNYYGYNHMQPYPPPPPPPQGYPAYPLQPPPYDMMTYPQQPQYNYAMYPQGYPGQPQYPPLPPPQVPYDYNAPPPPPPQAMYTGYPPQPYPPQQYPAPPQNMYPPPVPQNPPYDYQYNSAPPQNTAPPPPSPYYPNQ